MQESVKPYLNKGKAICKDSYKDLPDSHKKVIDGLLAKIPQAYDYYEKYAPVALSYVQNVSIDQVSNLIKFATKYLKKKETIALVREFIDTYGELVKDKRRMKAVGAYLRCVVSHLTPKQKEVIVCSFDLIMALVALVSDKKVSDFAKDIADLLHKNCVKPIVTEIKKKN